MGNMALEVALEKPISQLQVDLGQKLDLSLGFAARCEAWLRLAVSGPLILGCAPRPGSLIGGLK